jgi:26S proteasome regulatory subunit N9
MMNIYFALQIKSLLGTQVEWLYYILQAFNSGDLVRYQELCRVHNAPLKAQPALVQNEPKLLEKINILCLMEIIFRYICICNIFSLVV